MKDVCVWRDSRLSVSSPAVASRPRPPSAFSLHKTSTLYHSTRFEAAAVPTVLFSAVHLLGGKCPLSKTHLTNHSGQAFFAVAALTPRPDRVNQYFLRL